MINDYKFFIPAAVVAAALIGYTTTGCELIASVDRTLIPSGEGGTSQGGNTGGTGADGGMGGSGGQPPTCVAADCPGNDEDCRFRACVNDMCDFENASQGTTCTDAMNMDAQVCDGMGTCVQCNDNSDCGGATPVCDQNLCVGAECTDNMTNGMETDVDCGGPDCAPCANGLACQVFGDCSSAYCDTSAVGGGMPNGVCAACGSDMDCQSTDYCDGTTNCVTKLVNGDVCTGANECASANCIAETGGNICCDAPCSGTCESCLAADTPQATNGTCDDVTANTDPGNECGANFCDGAGVCAVCGDGTQQATEACDDGFTDACGTCNALCSAAGTGSTCGDGNTCPETEACDDGFTDACGTCNAGCTAAGSGSTCGDGNTCPETESCDDGFTDACGTCNAGCTAAGSGSTCGDGSTCPETEACDDGFTDACGTCNAGCTAAGSGSTCGDGSTCPETEACDDGFTDACGTCNANCTAAGNGSTCGDGAICAETENCDDFNALACGTCNATCTVGGQAGGDCMAGDGCATAADCTGTCGVGVANVCD